MGVDFKQYCLIGQSYSFEELETTISPEEYKMEDRYDAKTGKVTHQEKVIIKYEVKEYSLLGKTNECLYELSALLEKKGLICVEDDNSNTFNVGLPFASRSDYGRVTMLEGGVTQSHLNDKFDQAREIFGSDVMLIFCTTIG